MKSDLMCGIHFSYHDVFRLPNIGCVSTIERFGDPAHDLLPYYSDDGCGHPPSDMRESRLRVRELAAAPHAATKIYPSRPT